MLRIIVIELKRLFSNKLSLALVILAPVISLFFLASLIAPLFFSNRRLSQIRIAVFQEEFHPDAQMIIEDIVTNDRIQSLVDVVFVNSMVEGLSLTESGDVALFLHVPGGVIDNLFQRQPAKIEAWVSPEYYFEAGIITPLLNSPVDGFNRLQLALDLVYYRAAQELSREEAWQHYYDLTIFLGLRILNRANLFEIEGVSPLGKFLPVEYYTSAIFAFFTALGLVPLCGYNAKDFTSSALSRGLAVTRWRYKYLLARIISGTLYIILVVLPMLGVGIYIIGSNIFFGGNILALLVMTIVAALCFSSLSVLFALMLPKGDNAIWLGFYFILVMALVGGVIFPDDYIPQVLLTVARYSPLRNSMNSFAISLFNYQFNRLQFSLMVQLAWLVAASVISVPLFNRRARS